MRQQQLTKNYQKFNFADIKSLKCTNVDLSNLFVSDFLKVSGYEIDSEGYIVNIEDDILNPEYISIKGKFLRYTVNGILHNNDMIFDPYNDYKTIEELFKRYISECHPQISSFQIFNAKKDAQTTLNCYGYMVVLYDNGGQIITDNHWKDSTKFLDMWYRLESHDPDTIKTILKPYDKYEKTYFEKENRKKNKN